MLGWFKPSCPVDTASKAWVEWRLFWLARTLGHATLARIEVVRPTPEYLHANFDGSETAARVMYEPVAGWMGLAAEKTPTLKFFDRDKNGPLNLPFAVTEDRRDAIGFYQDGEESTIWVARTLLNDGEAMVGTMAHELAHARLLGGRLIRDDVTDMEPVTDLMTVYHGLGVIVANSVMRESNLFVAGRNRWSVNRLGYLPESQFGYALAVFAYARGESESVAWASDLRANVREVFRQGLRYLVKTGDALFTPEQYRGEKSVDPKATPEFAAAELAGAGASGRLVALWRLLRLGQLAATELPAIIAALRDSDCAVRENAAATLAGLGSTAQLAGNELVNAASRESDATVRQSLISAVAHVGADPGIAVPVFLTAWHDERPAVITMSTLALAAYADRLSCETSDAVVTAALPLIHHPDYDVAEQALHLLARLGPAAAPALDSIIDLLRGDCKALRPALLRVLGRAGVTRKVVFAALKAGAKARDPLAAAAAYDALGDLGGAAAEVLAELPDPRGADPGVRVARAAAEARILGRVADAVPVFRAVLAESADVLPEIVVALKQLAPTVTPVLIGDLGHSEPAARTFAVWALAGMQPRPAEVAAVLQTVTSDPDVRIANLARGPKPVALAPHPPGSAWRLQSCPPVVSDHDLENPAAPDVESLRTELLLSAFHPQKPH